MSVEPQASAKPVCGFAPIYRQPTKTMRALGSLFSDASTAPATERIDVIAETKNVTIERIVSSGSQPPASYVQDHDEWVLLVRGEAEMTVDGAPVRLESGDTLYLPAGVPHEVLHTSDQAVWLAVHVR